MLSLAERVHRLEEELLTSARSAERGPRERDADPTLERETGLSESDGEVLPAPPDPVESSGAGAEADDPHDPAVLERAISAVRAFRGKLDEELQVQGVDASWSYGQERVFRSALARTDLGAPTVLGVDCRTSLCALRLRFTGVAERERFFGGFRTAPEGSEMGPFFMVCEGWADTEVEVYVARDGYDLPLGDEP